ncbi:MAG: glycoside hydrolase family 18 protein, partial [Methanomicrobiales archaeon]|nr:glycoside hydrolase family 18 protein [Methanomicrobiales archaeon]
GALDDITFLGGIWMSKTRGVTWRVDSVPKYLQKAIDVCHQNDVQIFLGYTIGDEGGMISSRSKLFKEWIHDPASTGVTPAQHAQDICTFVFDQSGFDVDGIAFDLELNGLKAEDADNFGLFYGALADLLAAKGKVLSIATGVGNIDNESSWLGTFRAQPFRLAKGHPNFIIRPMAYDNFQLDDAAFLQWHKDIIDFALNKVGLDPGQFQLGLKISKNVHSQDASWLPPAGWTERKCTFDTPGIVDRCKSLLRPNGVGLATFAGWGDAQAFNAALNAGCDPAGTQGTPLQAPRGGIQAAPQPAQQADAQPQAQPDPQPKQDAPKQDAQPQAAASGRTRM